MRYLYILLAQITQLKRAQRENIVLVGVNPPPLRIVNVFNLCKRLHYIHFVVSAFLMRILGLVSIAIILSSSTCHASSIDDMQKALQQGNAAATTALMSKTVRLKLGKQVQVLNNEKAADAIADFLDNFGPLQVSISNIKNNTKSNQTFAIGVASNGNIKYKVLLIANQADLITDVEIVAK